MVFDNEVTNAQKIKSNFLSNLWNWTNLYSVVNTNSFVDFLHGLGVGRSVLLFVGVGRFFLWFLLVPSYSLPVYFLEPLGFFVLYTVFLLIKKKYLCKEPIV